MALSGSFDWNETVEQIVTRALRSLKQLGVGETASASQLSEGKELLNVWVKSQKNIYLWTSETYQQNTTLSTERTGTDGNIYTCILAHTSATATNKPITGTDWATYWTLQGETGGTWENAKSYTTAGDFAPSFDFLGLEKAFVRQDGVDMGPIKIIGKDEYFTRTDLQTFGKPEVMFLDRQLTRRIYVRPIPDDDGYVLHYKAIKPLNDLDSTSNNVDFPVEALLMLSANLSYFWSPQFSLDKDDRLLLQADAVKTLKDFKRTNKEVVTSTGVRSSYMLPRSGSKKWSR